MRKMILILLSVMFLATACAAGREDRAGGALGGDDAVAATGTYYQEAEQVLEAVQSCLSAFSLVPVKVEETGPGVFNVWVKKGVGNYLAEDVTRFVVRAGQGRSSSLQILVRTSFFTRWPDEPEWADGFFTAVFERLK
ncbi:MAG: hypothetical protein AB1896_10050 [Thermodesulfobacteriota bacterium]